MFNGTCSVHVRSERHREELLLTWWHLWHLNPGLYILTTATIMAALPFESQHDLFLHWSRHSAYTTTTTTTTTTTNNTEQLEVSSAQYDLLTQPWLGTVHQILHPNPCGPPLLAEKATTQFNFLNSLPYIRLHLRWTYYRCPRAVDMSGLLPWTKLLGRWRDQTICSATCSCNAKFCLYDATYVDLWRCSLFYRKWLLVTRLG
jgi:hypothetical protein